MQKPYNKRFAREYNWYRKHPEYFKRIQDRAEPYLHFILEEAEKRNMPTELVLLPVVESAFQPFAYSPGHAAGLWQFIPSTGRMYGLHQNWWYDGRRDVMASTRAALDYLQSLSKQFDGDWNLALASYNAGAGNVRRAIRKNKKKKLPTDYWSLKLPKETMTYVPRLLAVSQVFAEAHDIGLTLKPIPNEPQLAEISIDNQIDLAKAADMAGMSIEQLYQLNPAYNRWATEPGKIARLLVPVGKKMAFMQQLAQIDPKDLVEWQRYKIKNGDVLGKIAKKHNTTVNIIQDINKLKNSRIRAGKYLLIPVASKNSGAYKLSVTQRLKSKQAVKRKGNKVEHVVQPGDTLWDIARSYKLSHKRIASWNGIAPSDPLRIGQKLVLWTNKTASKPVVAFNGSPANRSSNIRYTIRKGDSLWRIADKFNVSVSDLKRWNSLNKRHLQPGETLKLTVNITEQL
ncbi:MAG: LysM peptidoglycan-binding domain-containing protein [Gammaproteobacteria bacterium]|nr:LysM peptidoglycan-binding domain-containing protein [Gammaproteobacteria bacterium]